MDITSLTRTCIKTAGAVLVGLFAIGALAGVLEGALSGFSGEGGSSALREAVQLARDAAGRTASARREGSGIRLIALAAGVLGPLGMGYLVLRHLDRAEGTGIGQFARMMDTLRQLQSLDEGERLTGSGAIKIDDGKTDPEDRPP